jgi:hypothetical protein
VNGEGKRTSPWVYVGVGCLALVLLAVVGVAAVGYFGYRKVKEFEAEMKDPEARTEKVQRALGADALPEGYHAVMAMSIPFVMDMAILSDEPPDAKGQAQGGGKRGFIYVSSLAPGAKQQALRDYFEGRGAEPEELRQQGINLERGELLKRGTVDVAGQQVMYIAQRGSINTRHGGGGGHGITTTMLVECPGSDRQRMAFWFGPDPDPEAAPEKLDLAGTPGDEAALRAFMGHFRLCGARS